eukprot:3489291-Amphidinium_carterae.1
MQFPTDESTITPALLSDPYVVRKSSTVERFLKDMRQEGDSGLLRLWEDAGSGGWRRDAKAK